MTDALDAQTPGHALAIALRLGRDWLSAVADDPMREARLLLAHAAGCKTDALNQLEIADFCQDLMSRYARLLERRAQFEPIAKIVGHRAFWQHQFRVTGNVLDPRPDTETLVALAIQKPFNKVLDLGTGSGCILLSLLHEQAAATGFGTDISKAALMVAQQNAQDLELAGRATFTCSNWFDDVDGLFDLIVSNPPYIAVDEMAGLQPDLSFEPRVALTDEGDGLSAYRTITAQAGHYLQAEGRLLVEIGHRQGAAVETLFEAAGFEAVQVHPDLDGRPRVVAGRWP